MDTVGIKYVFPEQSFQVMHPPDLRGFQTLFFKETHHAQTHPPTQRTSHPSILLSEIHLAMKKVESRLPPHKWTPEANAKFLAIIIQMYVDKIDYDEVAAKMGGVTAKAVKCQFLKVKGPRKHKTVGSKKKIKDAVNMKEESEDEM